LSLVSWVAIVVLAVCTINGVRLGMVRTIFSTFSFIAALILAIIVSPKVNTTLQESFLYSSVNQRVERALEGNPALTGEETDENSVIDNLPVPEFIRDVLSENNDESVYQLLGVDTFHHYLSAYITRLILRVLSFLLVFLAAVILLRLLCAALDAIAGLPVLHTMNKAGGLLFGFINGMIILWILCSFAALFSGTEAGAVINRQINDSIVLQTIYNKNLLLILGAGLKKIGNLAGLKNMMP
jgi:uncharacterized membrane protein required for colicin V production